jgi:DNA-directed RNA polymerase omega subunit
MVLRPLDLLDQRVKSRYEAVLVAAARARQINAENLAAEERGDEETPRLRKAKVTSRALHELLDGQIEFERVEE